MVQLSHPYMTTGKTIALTRQTCFGKVMSLLFNMLSAAAAAKSHQSCPTLCDPIDGSSTGSSVPGILQARILEWVAIAFSNVLSRLVITFLPRSKHLLILWLQSPCAVILEPPKIKSATVSTVSPSICHEVAGRNINNFRYADDTTLMAESEEELKSLLMKVKVESEKVGLKLNIQKTKIMASSPITSWEIDGETVSDFIFLGSKITADGDRSHEIKRRSLLGRKVMTNLDSIFKIRDIALLTNVRLTKAMVFPVVVYGCESWTVKKAEHRRIDAFELWCWRKRLRVPWTARRSNQSILKEISPGISLEGMMLKLKLQYFGHLM